MAEAVMRLRRGEAEPGALVDAARVDEDVAGPQDRRAVPRPFGEAEALVDETRAEAAPAEARVDEEAAQLRGGVVLAHTEDATRALAVDLGDPGRGARIARGRVLGD